MSNIMTPFSWIFKCGSAEHLIKYNIYYKPLHRTNWIKSNPEPLNHDPEGNEWSITDLSPGVTYYIAIVAGTLVNGEWVPFGSQSIVRRDRGILDVQTINNYPHYIVKTLVT